MITPVSKVRAARLLGLFARRDAHAAGLSADQIRRRVARGEWHVVIGSAIGMVFGPPGLRVTPQVRDVAAYVAVEGAALTGVSALRTYDIPVPDDGTHLKVPPDRRVRLAGVRVFREPFGPGDRNLFEDMRTVSCARAMFDCLRVLPEVSAMTFLDRALQREWIHLDELVRMVQSHAGRTGVQQVVKLIGVAAEGGQSHAERVLLRLLRRAGIRGWHSTYRLSDNGRLVAEADVAFPAVRLAIEVDGKAFHVTGDRFQRDRTRQNRLVAAGWTVLRFTWRDLTEHPDDVIATIRATLARLGAP